MVYLTIIAGLQAAAIVTVVLLLLRHQTQERQDSNSVLNYALERAAQMEKAATAQMLQAEKQWTDERRELLNRIQRPEHPVVAPVENYVMPEHDPDEIDLVGKILEAPLDEE